MEAGTDAPGAPYAEEGGLACMRSKGHAGPCVAMMRHAAIADGEWDGIVLPEDREALRKLGIEP